MDYFGKLLVLLSWRTYTRWLRAHRPGGKHEKGNGRHSEKE